MSRDWHRSHDMPDFTRSGNDVGGGGRLVWLLVVLAVLGGLVLFSAFSYAPVPVEQPDSVPAATEGNATGATASGD